MLSSHLLFLDYTCERVTLLRDCLIILGSGSQIERLKLNFAALSLDPFTTESDDIFGQAGTPCHRMKILICCLIYHQKPHDFRADSVIVPDRYN